MLDRAAHVLDPLVYHGQALVPHVDRRLRPHVVHPGLRPVRHRLGRVEQVSQGLGLQVRIDAGGYGFTEFSR